MQISVVPAESDSDGNVFAAKVSFDGVTPELCGERTEFSEYCRGLVSDLPERMPLLVIDVKGLRRKTVDSVLLKRLRIRGARTWFLTNVECAEDLFDAFNTDAEKVLFPVHAVLSEEDMEDILDVSDSAVPAIFVRDGRTDYIGTKMRLGDAASELSDMGFVSAAVFDLDGTVYDGEWRSASEELTIIPCSLPRRDEGYFEELGFGDSFRFP